MIKADSWIPANGLKLEPNAMLAATSQVGCQMVSAGPGSGKTELLAQRADFLLKTGTCRYPYRILAISFKVDASGNLASRVSQRCPSDLVARFDSYTFHAFAMAIIRRFRQHLSPENALDSDFVIGDQRFGKSIITFDDLLPFAIQIVEDSSIARNAIQSTYSDVFLDEFQDCSPSQYRLIQLCFKDTQKRLTAVGDLNQLIMRFALASDEIFNEFAKNFSAKSLPIYFNHRSEPTLLRLQSEIIQNLDPAASLSKAQLTGSGGELSIHAFVNSDEEAYFAAKKIEKWIKVEEICPSEIAVLIRQQISLYAVALFRELTARGILFKNEHDSQDLTSEPLARIVIDFLLVTHGDREPEAYERLIQLFTQISDSSSQREKSLLLLTGFLKEEQREHQLAGTVDLSRSVLNSVERLFEAVGKERLITLSAAYESVEFFELIRERILSSLTVGLSEGKSVINTLKELTNDQSVRVLTIHKCKGLEFHSVLLLGVEEQTFWGNSLDAEREFFVAVSRAKQRLLLTHVDMRPRPPKAKRRWDISRSRQGKFLDYAIPHVTS